MSAGLVILYQGHLTPHKAFLNPPEGASERFHFCVPLT
ncbi:MAG: hypothetical protein ACI9FJ_000696 [Alteromonadaceae bacterium]|jgi:hypothetical protein